ncbi:MAG: hypothetical protein M3R43_01480 [Acidobacteriota bacterium]|nr:hypothetical protein [Acidobacteriota bacterium]
MKVLLDHNLPKPLRNRLNPHAVFTARQMGWDEVANGDLIRVAETRGFEVLVTADKGIFYQQNNLKRNIGVVYLSNEKMRFIEPMLAEVLAAIGASKPGSFRRVHIPFTRPKQKRDPTV